MKMHKNCFHQDCSFWLRYASNRLSLTALPRPPSWFRGWPPRERKGGRGREGVPECPNPELASLVAVRFHLKPAVFGFGFKTITALIQCVQYTADALENNRPA